MIEINRIYNENCLQTMARMPDNFVDLIITSPPYNLGNNHHTENFKHFPYKDNLKESKYQKQQITILNELFRITTKEGWLFYNHKNRIKNKIMITPYSWLLKTEWTIRQEIVWINGTPQFDNCRFYPFTERIYCLAKSKESYLKNTLRLKDYWSINPVGTEGLHKRAFPDKLVNNIIASIPYVKLIYDPYCGSGTVIAAAVKAKKNWIASEIEKKYCDIIQKRIDPLLKQEKLFW